MLGVTYLIRLGFAVPIAILLYLLGQRRRETNCQWSVRRTWKLLILAAASVAAIGDLYVAADEVMVNDAGNPIERLVIRKVYRCIEYWLPDDGAENDSVLSILQLSLCVFGTIGICAIGYVFGRGCAFGGKQSNSQRVGK